MPELATRPDQAALDLESLAADVIALGERRRATPTLSYG
jgi:hypothetical protein